MYGKYPLIRDAALQPIVFPDVAVGIEGSRAGIEFSHVPSAQMPKREISVKPLLPGSQEWLEEMGLASINEVAEELFEETLSDIRPRIDNADIEQQEKVSK